MSKHALRSPSKLKANKEESETYLYPQQVSTHKTLHQHAGQLPVTWRDSPFGKLDFQDRRSIGLLEPTVNGVGGEVNQRLHPSATSHPSALLARIQDDRGPCLIRPSKL